MRSPSMPTAPARPASGPERAGRSRPRPGTTRIQLRVATTHAQVQVGARARSVARSVEHAQGPGSGHVVALAHRGGAQRQVGDVQPVAREHRDREGLRPVACRHPAGERDLTAAARPDRRPRRGADVDASVRAGRPLRVGVRPPIGEHDVARHRPLPVTRGVRGHREHGHERQRRQQDREPSCEHADRPLRAPGAAALQRVDTGPI